MLKDIKVRLQKEGHKFIENVSNASGYCMKCKQINKLINSGRVLLKNKKQIIIGECPICGTEVWKGRK